MVPLTHPLQGCIDHPESFNFCEIYPLPIPHSPDSLEKSEIFIIDVKQQYADALLGSKNQATDYTPYCMLRLLADKVVELPNKILYFLL